MSSKHLLQAFAIVLSISMWAVVARAQFPDYCNSTATGPAGILFACSAGDGDALAASGLTITVTVHDFLDVPIEGIPATDIWLISCGNVLALCGGPAAINASGPTDAHGQTTITAAFAAGYCDNSGVRAVVQGIVIGAGACGQPCIPLRVRSADISGDLLVNLIDFAVFAAGYPAPPNPYNACIDFASPYGIISLSDFAKYAVHHGHAC